MYLLKIKCLDCELLKKWWSERFIDRDRANIEQTKNTPVFHCQAFDVAGLVVT